MKKILIAILFLVSKEMKAQQNLSNNFLKYSGTFNTDNYRLFKQKIKNTSNQTEKGKYRDSLRKIERVINPIKLPVLGLFGASNLNEESFKTLNASGKASFYFRPIVYRNKALTTYLSYNLNASNNDSLLFSTLIFPEIGKNSFLGTLEWRTFWVTNVENGKNGHSLAPYFEFAYKTIKTDSLDKGRILQFTTLNYTVGLKYTFNVFREKKEENGDDVEGNLFATVYLSFLNVPDEDILDYRAVLGKGQTVSTTSLTDDFRSIGVKIGGQIKSFGLFADFRSVLGTENKIPLKELRGFHANIGVILNTEIFHLN